MVELHDTRKLGSLLKLDGRNPELAVMKAVETMHGEYGAAMVQPLKGNQLELLPLNFF